MQLCDFLLALHEGTVRVPEPFPASEWQHIYLTAITEPARFMELRATWANLRVRLAENFDDLDVGEDPATEPDAAGSALRKARCAVAALAPTGPSPGALLRRVLRSIPTGMQGAARSDGHAASEH